MNITLNPETEERLREFAARTNHTLSAVVNYVFNEWMDVYGDAILESQDERMRKSIEHLLKRQAFKLIKPGQNRGAEPEAGGTQ